MSADIKTEFNVPDLWFDVYARLIPGTVFMIALRFWSQGITTFPSASEAFLILGAGYIIGLIFSPFGSRIARFIEKTSETKFAEKNKLLEKKWLRMVQYNLGRNSRDSLILSKMHGEITMFVQLGMLTIIFEIQNSLKLIPGLVYSNFNLGLLTTFIIAVFFILTAFEIEGRRIIRAQDALKFYLPNPQLKNSEQETDVVQEDPK